MKHDTAYKKAGVNYSLLDPVKLTAQKAAILTKSNLKNSGFNETENSRGESAYIVESSDRYYAFVMEGLGTKNLIADEMTVQAGGKFYEGLAQDTVAMIINDLITVGAKPLVINAYWAVGDALWFQDEKKIESLVNGWKKACDLAGAAWGGGETPVLNKIIYPGTIDLAGSAFGIIKPKKRMVSGNKIKANDDIIFLASSGIHANGLSLARKIANVSKNKMEIQKLLMQPTLIYSGIINKILEAGIDIHYMVNITGHGWRKIMRAVNPFTYSIDEIGKVPYIFRILQSEAKLSDREMYSTFNMGAGFALIVNPKDSKKILKIVMANNSIAWLGGRVLHGKKQVNINPLGLTFSEDELQIRN